MNRDALLAQLRALRAQVDALIVAAGGELLEEEGAVGCPKCGEEERLENTGTFKTPRVTCLACGTSFAPGAPSAQGAAEELNHG